MEINKKELERLVKRLRERVTSNSPEYVKAVVFQANQLDNIRSVFARLMEYRERNTLNFQLEKLDDYLRELGEALND